MIMIIIINYTIVKWGRNIEREEIKSICTHTYRKKSLGYFIILFIFNPKWAHTQNKIHTTYS